jgi:predicted nuclease of predicted toxin-antitoxin system
MKAPNAIIKQKNTDKKNQAFHIQSKLNLITMRIKNVTNKIATVIDKKEVSGLRSGLSISYGSDDHVRFVTSFPSTT